MMTFAMQKGRFYRTQPPHDQPCWSLLEDNLRENSRVTYVEKKWVAFIRHTLLHSLCRKPCWQSPLASLVFPQPPVRARSGVSVPATQSCARPSATSHVPPLTHRLFLGCPRTCSPGPFCLSGTSAHKEEGSFPPNWCFLFPFLFWTSISPVC